MGGGHPTKRQLRLLAFALAVGVCVDLAGAFFSSQLSSQTHHTRRRCINISTLQATKDDGHAHQHDDFRRRRRRRNLEHWGVEHLASPPSFPSTFDEVAGAAFDAIVGTICGLQRPDPNFASNAMHRSVLDYRPTQPKWASRRRWADGDDHSGVAIRRKPPGKEKTVPVRMGLEIDGAAHLLAGQSKDEGKAMRILSLRIAERLSASPWDVEGSTGPRSVAIYFNSVDQSLLASRELRRRKQRVGNCKSLDHIYIRCLGQDAIPTSMIRQKRRRDDTKSSPENEQANPEEGILLVVKPTDYDTASLIPTHHNKLHQSHADEHQPTIQANVVDKLQSLLFQASASVIPVVVISPRLSELPPLQQLTDQYKRTGPMGFEQSGFQKSATYGGMEPPVGPTSWLLRDLVPPVYVWVGCANAQRHQSQMALTQSAMDAGHSWHMFAIEERMHQIPRLASHKAATSETHSPSEVRDVAYHYMGSSSAARGRPSSRVMNDMLEEFSD